MKTRKRYIASFIIVMLAAIILFPLSTFAEPVYVNVSNHAELTAALAAETPYILLTADITFDDDDEYFVIPEFVDITINGDNHVITGNGMQRIFCGGSLDSTYTFKNLTLKNAGVNDSGGAVYLTASAVFENCHFIDNTAKSGSGGAIYIDNRAIASLIITDCTFIGNIATGGGAGAGAISAYDVTVTNSVFQNNTADWYGGALDISGQCAITNCIFANNESTETHEYSEFLSGGAIHISPASYDADLTTIDNCEFYGNTAPYGGSIMTRSKLLYTGKKLFLYKSIRSW